MAFEPITPSSFVSPLRAGTSFEFVSAKTIFPYEVDAPYGTYYLQTVTLGGNTEFTNEYVSFPPSVQNNNIGQNVGFNTTLISGVYVVTYELYDYANGQRQDFLKKAVYTFAVVENKLPLKPWTISSVINRLLDLCEPIRRGESPRFRLQGVQANGSITENSLADRLDKIISPEFSFTKQTLRECLQEIGRAIHGEPRLTPKIDRGGVVLRGQLRYVRADGAVEGGEQATVKNRLCVERVRNRP